MSVTFRITFKCIQFDNSYALWLHEKSLDETNENGNFYSLFCMLVHAMTILLAIERKTCTGNFYHKVWLIFFCLTCWSLPFQWDQRNKGEQNTDVMEHRWRFQKSFEMKMKRKWNSPRTQKKNALFLRWKQHPSANCDLMGCAGHSHLNSPLLAKTGAQIKSQTIFEMATLFSFYWKCKIFYFIHHFLSTNWLPV